MAVHKTLTVTSSAIMGDDIPVEAVIVQLGDLEDVVTVGNDRASYLDTYGPCNFMFFITTLRSYLIATVFKLLIINNSINNKE